VSDIVKPLGAVEACGECGSELPMHFGGCSQHPTNQALAGRKPEPTSVADRPLVQTYDIGPPPNSWLMGAEIKVPEAFLKSCIRTHTGCLVKSVKFKGKQFVVTFD